MRVLTMEYLPGICKISSKAQLEAAGLDTNLIAR
jgi:predicted unusual protein kinase regulating ubiquinone biosynthesis (AarF/ABC1/UbiB family)